MMPRFYQADGWNCYAAGTGHPGRYKGHDVHSWDMILWFGSYRISPIANTRGHHAGYCVWFTNEKGQLPGGLWQSLSHSRCVTLPQARRLCREHWDTHFGPNAKAA